MCKVIRDEAFFRSFPKHIDCWYSEIFDADGTCRPKARKKERAAQALEEMGTTEFFVSLLLS